MALIAALLPGPAALLDSENIYSQYLAFGFLLALEDNNGGSPAEDQHANLAMQGRKEGRFTHPWQPARLIGWNSVWVGQCDISATLAMQAHRATFQSG